MTTGNMVHCQLWMGGLEPYMTESFILASFQRMGEKPLNVKVMRNKFTGEPAGYCFVHFENDDEAIDAMHKLNGKVIPNTNPAVRFRLNTATNQGKIMMNEREFSLWVGDLTPEVDDYTLYKTFAGRYQSIKAAKVILDASGYSKGFGFLRFGSEDEQKHCLQHMNGYKGLGSKPLKISNAIPKTQRTTPTNGTQPAAPPTVTNQYNSQDYSHYYDPSYWQNYSNWSGYYDGSSGGGGYSYDPSQYPQQYPAQQYPSSYPPQYYQQPPPTSQPPPTVHPTSVPPPSAVQQVPIMPGPPPQHQLMQSSHQHDEANEIVEHTPLMNVDRENEEYGESVLNFYTEVTDSSWIDWEIFEIEMSKLKTQSMPEDN